MTEPETVGFYDFIEVRAGSVPAPPGAVVPGYPVITFRFSSSEPGPPDLIVNLVTEVSALHALRMLFGNVIDSAMKIGRRLR